jgi:hypothetical protein
MSPDHSEPAPPLGPEDLALESSLRRLRPPVVPAAFLDRLLTSLELAVADDHALATSDSPPMPLDSSLLAFEHELRALRPLDMDFPTGQRVLRALEREMTPALPAAAAAPTFPVLTGSPRTAPRRKWSAAMPWAAAAALVALGWVALPLLSPRTNPGLARASEGGLIPYASRSGEKGSVFPVFPETPGKQVFGRLYGQRIGDELNPDPERNSDPAMRSLSIPEATSPYGYLNIDIFDLPEEYCQKLGISHGVGIMRMGEGGPASTQGLEVGDIIMRINGAPVSTADEFSVMVKNSEPGSVIILEVMRGRLTGKLRVRLGSAPTA